MHLIPGCFWGICVLWHFWVLVILDTYNRVWKCWETDRLESFCLFFSPLVRLMTSNVPEEHKQPGEMSVPLWEQRLSELALLPPRAASLPCGWSAAASAQPAPVSLGVGGFCLHSGRNVTELSVQWPQDLLAIYRSFTTNKTVRKVEEKIEMEERKSGMGRKWGRAFKMKQRWTPPEISPSQREHTKKRVSEPEASHSSPAVQKSVWT